MRQVCPVFQTAPADLRPAVAARANLMPAVGLAEARRLNSRKFTGNEAMFNAMDTKRKRMCASRRPERLSVPIAGPAGQAANQTRIEAEESCRV
jgi:hypothetical protein